jgi:hypothetical protein
MAVRRMGGVPILATLALVAVGLWAAAPAGAAGKKTCWVKNTTLAKSYGSAAGSVLQDAIDKAGSGNNLEVRGLCIGNFTIDKSLTLVGVAKNGYPVAQLDGNQTGSVLSVYSSVTVTDLTITNGDTGTDGGGIFNDDGGTLTMNGSSSVSGNTAGDDGGGIYNAGTLTMNDSSSVSGNTASVDGGGIFNSGILTMNDSSTVSGNTSGNDGGGIFSCGALVGASDASGGNVYDNDPNNISTCT